MTAFPSGCREAGLTLLFDVDGVLTDEDARPDEAAIGDLGRLVEAGAFAALVTGRARTWLHRMISRTLEPVVPPSARGRVAFAAEFGAIRRVGFHLAGSIQRSALRVPSPLRRRLRTLSLERPYRGLLEWDPEKECCATVEAVHGAATDDRHRARTRLALDSFATMATMVVEGTANRVQPARFAVDVVPNGLSKAGAAEWVVAEANRGRERSETWIFGDSPADAAMAEGAVRAGASRIRFVWVGESCPPSVPTGVSVIVPRRRFALGTREALEALA